MIPVKAYVTLTLLDLEENNKKLFENKRESPRRSDGFIICNFSVHILLVARVAELRGHLIRHFVLCLYVANLGYTSIRHCITI